jgi:hypothetical protein
MTRGMIEHVANKVQSATAYTSALTNCKQGYHTLTPTFRPGEKLCLICGVVYSCPFCVREHNLPPVTSQLVFVLLCDKHKKGGVQQ